MRGFIQLMKITFIIFAAPEDDKEDDNMSDEADWERLADPQMISARYMVMLAVIY